MILPSVLLLLSLLRGVLGHISIWSRSMYGYNVTGSTFAYDNRPVTPLYNGTFVEWWYHNHIDYPPHPDDVFELPAGKPATAQLACNKGATTYWAQSQDSSRIENPNNPNDPCPGSKSWQYHTTGLSDVKGCALGIAYKDDISQVTPEDIAIFSVNHTCVWNRFTDFQVPKNMPPCPNGKCICSFHWIHSPDSGSEQMYMNGFNCNVTNSVTNVPLAKPQVARRCGAEPDYGKPDAVPGNCTWGAKQPLYWLQAERNNMHEGYYGPPYYNDLYNFRDGAQDDIFENFYKSIPVPGPNQTELPVPSDGSSNQLFSSGTSGDNNTTPASTVSSSTASGSSTTPTPTDSSSIPPVSSTTQTDQSTTSGGNSMTPAVSSATTSSSSTTPTVSSTTSDVPSSSATPSKDAECPSERSTGAVSRRHDFGERRSPFSHKRRHARRDRDPDL